MRILIVVGDDKLGRKFINSIDYSQYLIVLDKSSSLSRIIRLIKKGVLKISLIFKMFIAELLRKNYNLPQRFDSIKSNNDLLKIIQNNNIEKVIIFRGGLIINKQLLNQGIDILNIHCAKLPEYGGIGVIQKALNDKAYEQEATLYKITEKIDNGEIIFTKKYILNPKRSYKYNEDLAYNTGIELFKEYFEK